VQLSLSINKLKPKSVVSTQLTVAAGKVDEADVASEFAEIGVDVDVSVMVTEHPIITPLTVLMSPIQIAPSHLKNGKP
jgi:hypothetical protein